MIHTSAGKAYRNQMFGQEKKKVDYLSYLYTKTCNNFILSG